MISRNTPGQGNNSQVRKGRKDMKNMETVMDSLQIMGVGMASIFVVITLIMLIVMLLRKITKKK